MSVRRLKEGDLVKHFTWETKEYPEEICIYKIIKFGFYLDSLEKIVIYKPLSSNEFFVKLYDDFIGEVDHVKYPQVKQKYKYEKITKKEIIIDIYTNVFNLIKTSIRKFNK